MQYQQIKHSLLFIKISDRTQPNKLSINVLKSMMYIDYKYVWLDLLYACIIVTYLIPTSSNELEDEELSDMILSKATSPNAGRMIFW